MVRERLRSIHAVLRAAVVLCTMGLAGCGWILDDEGIIQDRRDEYRSARVARAPELPEDLSGEAIGEMMPIRDVSGMDRYLAQEVFELPRPATLFAREEDLGVRIQRFEGGAWIVAPDPPTAVWPRVKQFLSDNGVSVLSEDPEAGIMVTRWIELVDEEYPDLVRRSLVESGAAGPWHQLELRVEQAVRRGATELHVIQYGAFTPSGRPDFEAGSTSIEAEARLRTALAEYLAAELGGAGVSFVAQTIAAEPKAEIIRRSNEAPVLMLRLPFTRAWATVSSALDNAEIDVESRDQDARTYRIYYNEVQFRGEEPGWFASLLDFSSDSASAKGDLYVLRLEDRDGQGFEIRVLDDEDQPADRETGEQILSVIREFAS